VLEPASSTQIQAAFERTVTDCVVFVLAAEAAPAAEAWRKRESVRDIA